MEITDVGLYIAYAVFLIAAAAAVLFPLINSIKNPAAIGKSLIGIVAMVALFIVAYVLSGDEVSAKYTALGVDAGGSKLIGAGLTMFYFVITLGFLGIIYSEVSKAFK
jgi:hypothetical protein